MTAKEIFTAVLMELNKNNAPSIDLETFNYFFNKAINQFVNKQYNLGVDTDQQRTDNIRVLKTSAILKPFRTPKELSTALLSDAMILQKLGDENLSKGDAEVINLDSVYGATYEFNLPADYLHLLNCICIFRVLKRTNCPYNIGDVVTKGATKITADAWPLIIDNLYMRPSYKRPYYYINNINTSQNNPTNPVNESPEYVNETIPFGGTDYAFTRDKLEYSFPEVIYSNGKITPVTKGSLTISLDTALKAGLVIYNNNQETSVVSNKLSNKIKHIEINSNNKLFTGTYIDSAESVVSTCPGNTSVINDNISTQDLNEQCITYTTELPINLVFTNETISSLQIPNKTLELSGQYNNVLYDDATKFTIVTETNSTLEDCKLKVVEGSYLDKVLKYNINGGQVSINNKQEYNQFISDANKLESLFPGKFIITRPVQSIKPVETPDTQIQQEPTEGTPSYKRDSKGDIVSINIENGAAKVDNPNFPRYMNVNGVKESSVVKYAGHRYGNTSNTRLEIRYGKDTSVFKLIGIQIDYIKAPQYIRLTQEQVDLTEDTSQIMEFPDYICQEIINGLTENIMENASDPRLQSHIPISQSIANPAQQQDTTKK